MDYRSLCSYGALFLGFMVFLHACYITPDMLVKIEKKKQKKEDEKKKEKDEKTHKKEKYKDEESGEEEKEQEKNSSKRESLGFVNKEGEFQLESGRSDNVPKPLF